MKEIPIEVSARHVHLSQEDLDALFGIGKELTKLKDLSQSGDFAAKETLTLKAGDKQIEEVRAVGPVRKHTQIELSLTDAFNLGLNLPLAISGSNLENNPVILAGPEGEIEVKTGAMIALRHIHCNQKEAKELGIKEGDLVSVKVKGDRGLVFDNVSVRIGSNYSLAMHIDTDEGNAAGIDKKGTGILI